jgi:hypothetical protein
VIDLTWNDTNDMKRELGLAFGTSDTYLRFSETLVSDMNLLDNTYTPVSIAARVNKVVAIPDGSAVQVTQYTSDSTAPAFWATHLDMDAGRLWLSFDEVVFTPTVDPTMITLHNAGVGAI